MNAEYTQERIVNSHRLQQGVKGIWACLCLHYRPKATQFAALLVPQEVCEAPHSVIGKPLAFRCPLCRLSIPIRGAREFETRS